MIGKGFWVRTFLVAVGILATMGMNIHRIHTIGGFDNAAENNTHLLDRSYGSGDLLDGSMDRMPYNLDNSFDVRNDSITDLYVRDSISNTMDLSQVMDMKPEISRFKRNINNLEPVRIKREDGKEDVNEDGNEEMTDASFILESSALSNFSERCISLNKEIMDLYSKSDSDKQITKDLFNKFSFHFDQFDINGGVKINFTTEERRDNAKSIFFALTDIANKVGNSIVKVKQNTDAKPNTEALQYAQNIVELTSDKLTRMLVKIPSYNKNRKGLLVDFFNVGALSCNPICGNAIEYFYSDRNLTITEAHNAKYDLVTYYDGTNNRCNELNGKSNTSIKLYKDIKNLLKNHEKGDMNVDQSINLLIEQFTALENDLYAKLQDKKLCLALRSCCSMRKLLKYLSKTAVVIDDACGAKGQIKSENVSYAFYTSLKKISNQSKDIIIRLITKIDECRTNSVETEKANVQNLSVTQEVSTTTVSSSDENTFKIEVVTDKPASLNDSSGSGFLSSSRTKVGSGNPVTSGPVAVSGESALSEASNIIVSPGDQKPSDESDESDELDESDESDDVLMDSASSEHEVVANQEGNYTSVTEIVLDNLGSSNPTVSQEDQDQPRTTVVTNQEGNYTSGNNASSVSDVRTNNTQLKDDSKLQSTDGSSSDKSKNVAASSGYLHSSVASNTLVSSLFILIATLLQRFQ